MVLTVRAKARAQKVIPAVIHHDGTSRIQIVRKENNPLIHDYLNALKGYIGAAVSVNTSLNVGGPIVQTPDQAVEALGRAKGMDGLFMVGETGDVFMVWPRPGSRPLDSRLARPYPRVRIAGSGPCRAGPVQDVPRRSWPP